MVFCFCACAEGNALKMESFRRGLGKPPHTNGYHNTDQNYTEYVNNTSTCYRGKRCELSCNIKRIVHAEQLGRTRRDNTSERTRCVRCLLDLGKTINYNYSVLLNLYASPASIFYRFFWPRLLRFPIMFAYPCPHVVNSFNTSISSFLVVVSQVWVHRLKSFSHWLSVQSCLCSDNIVLLSR